MNSDLTNAYVDQCRRRTFLRHSSGGIGIGVLASLFGQTASAADSESSPLAGSRAAAAFSREGETRDSLVHGGRSVAPGNARLQTQAA